MPTRDSRTDQARWFAEEVQPHEPALRVWLQRKYPASPDMDDFVQESFLRTILAWKRGRLTSARGFLFHVARNTAVSFFRKRRKISAVPVDELPEQRLVEKDVDVFENVCSREQIELVSEAIAGLPARCRQILLCRLMRGMEYSDIARELGVSEATVRVQVARGMKKCTELLCRRGVIAEEAP